MEPELVAFAADHPGDVLVVNYHPWWTSPFDPFYLHNIADNSGRTIHYGIVGVPYLLADGMEEPEFLYDYASISAAYDLRKAVPTTVSLSIGGSYDAVNRLADVTVDLTSDSPLPAGIYRLHVAITESGIAYSAENGVEIHDHVMRRMIPDFAGSPVEWSGGGEPSAQIAVSFPVDPLYLARNCRVICWLQNDDSEEILQAAGVELLDLGEPSPVSAEATWSEIKARFPAKSEGSK